MAQGPDAPHGERCLSPSLSRVLAALGGAPGTPEMRALPGGEAGSRWGPVIPRSRETQARACVTHRDVPSAQQGAAREQRGGPGKPAVVILAAPGSVQPGTTVVLVLAGARSHTGSVKSLVLGPSPRVPQ